MFNIHLWCALPEHVNVRYHCLLGVAGAKHLQSISLPHRATFDGAHQNGASAGNFVFVCDWHQKGRVLRTAN